MSPTAARLCFTAARRSSFILLHYAADLAMALSLFAIDGISRCSPARAPPARQRQEILSPLDVPACPQIFFARYRAASFSPPAFVQDHIAKISAAYSY